MSAPIQDFDLNAALLRHSETDLRAFMAALAVRLETALPGRVNVERKRDGLFSSASHVHAIEVTPPEAVYRLTLGKPALTATRAKSVRGVTLSTQSLTPRQWLADLNAAIADLGERAADDQEALHGFL